MRSSVVAAAGAMVGGEAAASVEKLVSGVRQAADFAEQFRSYSESEKQWKARMEFILRHLPDYRDPPDGGGRLDQLLSLSMVWANHLFLGCRCGPPPAYCPRPHLPTLTLAVPRPTLNPAQPPTALTASRFSDPSGKTCL